MANDAKTRLDEQTHALQDQPTHGAPDQHAAASRIKATRPVKAGRREPK